MEFVHWAKSLVLLCCMLRFRLVWAGVRFGWIEVEIGLCWC